MDHPYIKEAFSKCDNAECYHANYYPESLHHICKKNDIALHRLDYNEPQKGKDQCDRDSAVAQNALRNHVNKGNKIISAEDLYDALVNSGMKHTQVSVVSFDKYICSITAAVIAKISIYHSVEFKKSWMKLVIRWYYNIVSGDSQPYSKQWSFTYVLK